MPARPRYLLDRPRRVGARAARRL